MNKFFTVFMHTYTTKIKSKSFIFTTLITLLFMYAFFNFDRLINYFQKNEDFSVIVSDRTGELYEQFEANLAHINDNIHLQPFHGTDEEGIEKIENKEANGFLVIDYDSEGLPKGTYRALTIVEQTVPMQLEQALQNVKQMMLTQQLNISNEQMAKIFYPVFFEKIAIAKGAKSERELNQARVFVYFLLFIIYFTVILFGNMIATEIAIEKSSRVMEILISSSSPLQQMFGKIFGIALLGLTQYLFLFVFGFFMALQRIQSGSFSPEISELVLGDGGVPLHLIRYAVLFFLLGYFLYATVAAMLGSLVSRIEDVNYVMTPLVMLIVAAFMIAMFGLTNPESSFITVTSFIPFFAPMIMFLRVGMLTLPAWEIVLSIAILILTIVLMAWISAKVYRGGVLIYGKSFSLKHFKQALMLSKNEKS